MKKFENYSDLLPPPEAVSGLISLRRFTADLDIVPSTAWRWIQRKWLDRPYNIGGRLYLSADMIQRFRDRAARGEFAVAIKPPLRIAQTPAMDITQQINLPAKSTP